MTKLTAEQARATAQAHIDQFYPCRQGMVVIDVSRLDADAGWIAWPQTTTYLRTNDPLDSLLAPPLLITAGPAVTQLPTAVTVEESLAAQGLRLAQSAGV